MSDIRLLLAGITGLSVLAGCQSEQQMLASGEGIALQTAEQRGQFELDCPSAKGEILSSKLPQALLLRGMGQAEYTVAVSGCGKRSVYVVICPQDASICYAGASRDNPEITQ